MDDRTKLQIAVMMLMVGSEKQKAEALKFISSVGRHG